MATTAEKKSVVGLKDLYYALVTQDDVDAYAAGTPALLAPLVNASHKPVSNSKSQYADDTIFEVIISEGETKIDFEVTGIPYDTLAAILGKVYDVASGRMFDNAGTPPDIALSFRSIKSNGKYKYFQYLKGKFSLPEEEQATKTDTPEPKTVKISFTAVKTIYEFDLGSINGGVKRVAGDEDSTGFSGTTWFDAVQVPVAGTPDALTCTPDPIDTATGVAVSKTITLTFNNALAGNVERGIILTTAAGVVKACGRTVDAARKVVTLDPSTNLAGGTTYLIIVPGVIDIYGQTLADTVYDFATT